MRTPAIFGVGLALAIGCGGEGRAPASAPSVPVGHGARGKGAGPLPPPPAGALTVAEARRYMVKLINRHRESEHLSPVELDEGAPTRAGQRHAEDMARHGFLGHWGSDGSVPEQRFTEAGGTDFVQENAACVFDEAVRPLDPTPAIDPKDVEHTEDMFFHEVPPNDGHRRNILAPHHRKVGIGVAQSQPTPTEIPSPCFAQEFVDPYGTYGAVPRRAHVGDVLHVEGALRAPAAIAGVGLARVDAPRPLSTAELNRRRSYLYPSPFALFWPKGYKTPIPLQVEGNRFRIDVPLSDDGRPGLYTVSVWAKMPGVSGDVMVSARTIAVDRR